MVEDLPRAREPHEVDFGELPELTRALRALGSGRRKAGAIQALFFRPLLEARRKAEAARTATARVRAFEAGALEVAMESCVDRIVADWQDTREPARRAIRAQLLERLHDYRSALQRLRDAADDVVHADDDMKLDAWRTWTAQLRGVFHCADRSWLAIEAVVAALPGKPRR